MARAAEARAKEIEGRAESRRAESERTANDTVEKARALSEKTVTEARSEASRLLNEARTEAEFTTNTARREVEELTRQKDAVTNQLGQMLSGLSGLVPAMGSAAAKTEKAETPSQRSGESAKPGADKSLAGRSSS